MFWKSTVVASNDFALFFKQRIPQAYCGIGYLAKCVYISGPSVCQSLTVSSILVKMGVERIFPGGGNSGFFLV